MIRRELGGGGSGSEETSSTEERREPEDSIRELDSTSESDPMTDLGDTTSVDETGTGGPRPVSAGGGEQEISDSSATSADPGAEATARRRLRDTGGDPVPDTTGDDTGTGGPRPAISRVPDPGQTDDSPAPDSSETSADPGAEATARRRLRDTGGDPVPDTTGDDTGTGGPRPAISRVPDPGQTDDSPAPDSSETSADPGAEATARRRLRDTGGDPEPGQQDSGTTDEFYGGPPIVRDPDTGSAPPEFEATGVELEEQGPTDLERSGEGVTSIEDASLDDAYASPEDYRRDIEEETGLDAGEDFTVERDADGFAVSYTERGQRELAAQDLDEQMGSAFIGPGDIERTDDGYRLSDQQQRRVQEAEFARTLGVSRDEVDIDGGRVTPTTDDAAAALAGYLARRSAPADNVETTEVVPGVFRSTVTDTEGGVQPTGDLDRLTASAATPGGERVLEDRAEVTMSEGIQFIRAADEQIQERERRQEAIQRDFALGRLGDPQEIREEQTARQVSEQLGFEVTDEDVSLRETDDGDLSVELSDEAGRAAALSSSGEFLRRDVEISRSESGEFEVNLPGDSETIEATEEALTQKIRTGEAFGGETSISAFGHTITVEQDLEAFSGWVGENIADPTADFLDEANVFNPAQSAFTGDNPDSFIEASDPTEAADTYLSDQAGNVIRIGGEVPSELLEAGEVAADPQAWEIAGSAIEEGGQSLVRNPNQELWTTSDVEGAVETGERLHDLGQENPEVAAGVIGAGLAGATLTAGFYAAGPAIISGVSRVSPRAARGVTFAFDPVRSTARATDSAIDSGVSAVRRADGTPDIGPEVSVVRDSDAGFVDIRPGVRQQFRRGVTSRVPSREGVRSDLSQRIESTRERAGIELVNAELQRRVAAEAVRDLSVDDAIDAGRTAARRAREAGTSRVPESPTLRLDFGEPSARPSRPLGDEGRVDTLTEFEGSRGASGRFSAQVFDDPYSGLLDVNVNRRLRPEGRPSLPTLPDSPTLRLDVGEPSARPSRPLGDEGRVDTLTEFEGSRGASGRFSAQLFDDPQSGLLDANINVDPRSAARGYARTSFDRFQAAGRTRADRNLERLFGLPGTVADRVPLARRRGDIPESPTVRLDIGEPSARPSRDLSGEAIEQTRTEYVGDRRASGPVSVQAIGDPESGPLAVNLNTGPRDAVGSATAAASSLRDLTVRVEPRRPPRTPMTRFIDADDAELTPGEREVFEAFDTDTVDASDTGTSADIPSEGGSAQIAETRVGVTARGQDAGPNAEFRGIVEIGETPTGGLGFDEVRVSDVGTDLQGPVAGAGVGQETPPFLADATEQDALEAAAVEPVPVVGQSTGIGLTQGPMEVETPGLALDEAVTEIETEAGARPPRGREPPGFPDLDSPDGDGGPAVLGFVEEREQFEEELVNPLTYNSDDQSDQTNDGGLFGGLL